MAAPSRLRIPLLLLCCAALAATQSQTPWPPPSIPAVDPTTASTTISRRFLSDEQHRLLTSPSFGQRLTTRPRLAARPATRRDWTPIWPGGQGADGSSGSSGGSGSPAVVTARPSRPSRRPDAPPSLAPSRPPVTEYYFASSAVSASSAPGEGSDGGPSFPPAQLPTATFVAPAATPTRALPSTASRRPSVTRLGLADRLSALVTSRPARTTIISPTRAAPAPPSSALLRPTPSREEDIDNGLGLEPSTLPPWSPERTSATVEPTAAPAAPAAAPAAAEGPSSSDGEVSPTPVSPPCVVTPQHPGGYCRDGDILTVFTRDPAGNWAAYRTVQLPSSTVRALDGDAEGEETTPDPGPSDQTTDQTTDRTRTTPADEGVATVTSPPLVPEPTEASIAPIPEPAGEREGVGSGARDHLPSAGPTRPSVGPTLPSAAGPTLPSDVAAAELDQITGDEGSEFFPTATSVEPGPQPPTVGPRAGAGADGGGTPPPTASEAEKSGVSEPEAAPEEGKVTVPPTLPGWTTRQTTRWRASPTSRPPTIPTEPPSTQTTRGTTREATQETTREGSRQTTAQTPWEDSELTTEEDSFPTTLETFPTTLETFPTTPEAFTTAPTRGQTTFGGPSPTTPPPTWPPSSTPSDESTPQTAPPTLPEEDWASATSAAPPETTWSTLPPGAHPETTQHTSEKSAELGKVSVSHATPTRASNGTWPGRGTTDDGFSTGTYHYTTGAAFDYPTGPTGFTSHGGVTGRPGSHFATGSTRQPTTTGQFTRPPPTAPSGPGDYDYTTGPSGDTGNGFYGEGFPYSTGNYTTIGHGRLTPPPPPAGVPTFTTAGRPVGTGVTSTSWPSTSRGTTPESTTVGDTTIGDTTTDTTVGTTTGTTGTTTDTTVGTTPGTSRGTTPSTSTSPGITHSSVVPPVELYVQFLIGTTWPRFCRVRQAFKQRVVDLVNGETHRNLTADSAVLFNIPVCGRPVRARRETDPSSTAILVFLYLTDSDGQYDRALTERVEPLWESAAAEGGGGSSWDGMARLVREVDTVQPEQLVQTQEHSERAGVIAAITVGCVAVASLVLLAVLLVVVRHRRRAAQTAQRCNPVNMEEYGVESVFSSMRRKNKMRRSVRSYLNQAFDDHDAPSNAVNFAGLANLSGDLAALKEEFDSIPTGAMPTLDDLPPGSEDRNRYANVLPVPETRVVLDQKTGAPNSDYINANYVRGPKDEPQFYIATQGPLESTVNDFWRMIWETQSKVVICLTDIVERGVRRCAEYLPPSEALDRHRLYGDFQVTLMAKTKKDKFVVSTIQLKNMDSNLFREVTHLWYSGWPERGVPSDLDSMVEFLQEARRAMKTNIGPTVVHCSPGTGRTGVLLACDICMRQFDATRTTDIMRTVFRIRHDRAGAVQTREQYALIYKVLNQYAASVTSGNLPALE